MCESTVSLSHTVHVFLALEGAALVVIGIHDLGCELVGHSLAATLASVTDHILHADALLTVGTDLSRHLESGTTDAAALDLYLRGDVVEGLFPNFKAAELVVGHLGADEVEGVVEDFVGCVLFAVVHQVIDELGDFDVTIDGVGKDDPLLGFCFSHCFV